MLNHLKWLSSHVAPAQSDTNMLKHLPENDLKNEWFTQEGAEIT